MNLDEFKKNAHELVDWMANYLENIRDYPVKSQCQPGDTLKQLPKEAPLTGESFEKIMTDFHNIIMPGITHWQHPRFHAYFPGNSSPPSILGEMLTATLGAQCMSWQTSPAATELEQLTLCWLAKLIGLPEQFSGVIYDGAQMAVIAALIAARDKFQICDNGFSGNENFTAYCSTQTHSAIDKAAKISGIGSKNLRKINVDKHYAMDAKHLAETIEQDIASGKKPLFVVATFGSTSSTAIDPLAEIALICKKHDIWLHVDAAYAGSALILPEYQHLLAGVEDIDSFAFNPHKWLFTNFDCTAFYVKDKSALINSFGLTPEFLRTKEDDEVNNYRDWGMQLGRRFRALKLWFVLRSYGVENLQEKLRLHMLLAQKLVNKIEQHDDFELLTECNLNLICFRYHPKNINDENELNELNEKLLQSLNATGKLYLTHTKLNNQYTLRIVIGQTYVTEDDVDLIWETLLTVSHN